MSEYEPITAAIRKSLDAGWDPWPAAREGLRHKCDAIDAVHAGLERENAELRARVAELDEMADTMHETDAWKLGFDEGFASADDWMADNEDAMAEHGWYRALDADKKPIHLGDEVYQVKGGWVYTVESITFYSDNTTVSFGCKHGFGCDSAHNVRHYHAPTVKDVLRELWDESHDDFVSDRPFDRDAIIERYAKRLQLAEVDE